MDDLKRGVFLKKLSAFEVSVIVSEMQSLIGARLQRIYQLSNNQFLFQFHVPSKGNSFLHVVLPLLLFISSEKPPAPKNPSKMCSLLRKYLTNVRLSGVSQPNFERIIQLDFGMKSENFKSEDSKNNTSKSNIFKSTSFKSKNSEGLTLFIELFSKGNLLLCRKEGFQNTILGVLESQTWKNRTLKQGVPYKLPPKQIVWLKSPFSLNLEDFFHLLNNSDKELVKFLAVDLGLGGLYSEEVCLCSKANKMRKASEISRSEAENIFKEILNLQQREPRASVVYEKENEEQIIDVVPIELMLYSNNKKQFFASFSEALNFAYRNMEALSLSYPRIIAETFEKGSKASKVDSEIERLQTIIKEQQKVASELEKKSNEDRERAEAIYVHYTEIKEVLDFIKEELKKGSLNEAAGKLKKFKSVDVFDKEKKKIFFVFNGKNN